MRRENRYTQVPREETLDGYEDVESAAMLKGRHDFIRFRALDPSRPRESAIVAVDDARVEEQDDLALFRIEASHFLWRMVRRLASPLLQVGRAEIALDDFRALLNGVDLPHCGVAAWTAPTAGLFLEKARYPGES